MKNRVSLLFSIAFVVFVLTWGELQPWISIKIEENKLLKQGLLAEQARRETFQAGHQALIAKYHITLTTSDVREFVKREMFRNFTEEQLNDVVKQVQRRFEAAEAVYEKQMTADEAAEHYFGEHPERMVPILKQDATKERIAEMRRMLPTSIDDMAGKSTKGDIMMAEAAAIAKHILSATEQPEMNPDWYHDYQLTVRDMMREEATTIK